jgi:hypothetical protein
MYAILGTVVDRSAGGRFAIYQSGEREYVRLKLKTRTPDICSW